MIFIDTITVSPAYGRDYKSSQAAKSAWMNESDFVIEAIMPRPEKPIGRYVSTIEVSKGSEVRIRFNRKQSLTTLIN